MAVFHKSNANVGCIDNAIRFMINWLNSADIRNGFWLKSKPAQTSPGTGTKKKFSNAKDQVPKRNWNLDEALCLYHRMLWCRYCLSAVWGGAKLADVLELVGIAKWTSTTKSGGKHVEFVSIDKCKEENGGPYKASIRLNHATSPEADVLLAYEMNGEPLKRDHGYPLRVVVPGVIGARSVKWLDSINIIAEECQGFFMQKDYKMFPPSVNWDNINWSTRRPQMDFPVRVYA
ncbi:sulfite oxidase-like [Manihot esculenta]|uniref:sulfite oxidase-like n=1 Tax=Manihot esculenta TaxID=3983 RepID=UPI001CC5BB5D|nr:sulfite oxidase-like [Manihot esculenta]